MSGDIPPLPQYIFTAWYLVKPRDKFTLPSQIKHKGGERERDMKNKSKHSKVYTG
jgi:hypothetical protein